MPPLSCRRFPSSARNAGAGGRGAAISSNTGGGRRFTVSGCLLAAGAGEQRGGPGDKRACVHPGLGCRLALRVLLGGDQNLPWWAARPAGIGVLGADAVAVFSLVSFEG